MPTVGGGGGAGRDPFTGMSTVKLPGVFRATNLVPSMFSDIFLNRRVH